jgi:Fe-Mn family superoxide dismutase
MPFSFIGVFMTITLPPLPYAQNALEPHITANTLSFHHGKHHKAYVDKTNELIAGTPLAGKSLEEIIMASAKDKGPLFNNAAQVWNHTFYWNSMKPNGGGAPKGKLAQMIDRDFGSLDKFKEAFKQAGVTQFGSGWAWLVLDGDTLESHQNPQRRSADGAWPKSPAHHGRMGACLLPRFPEPPPGLYHHLPR